MKAFKDVIIDETDLGSTSIFGVLERVNTRASQEEISDGIKILQSEYGPNTKGNILRGGNQI